LAVLRGAFERDQVTGFMVLDLSKLGLVVRLDTADAAAHDGGSK
jgi:hypothetical protein